MTNMPSTVQAKYEDIRDIIKTGHIAMFHGKGLYTKIIRATTGIPTHVGCLHVEEGGSVGVWEALNTGVVKNFASQRIIDYDGCVWIATLKPWALARLTNHAAMHEYLQRNRGARYSWTKAVLSFFGQITRIPGKSWGRGKFCSELVAGWLKAGGLDLGADSTPTPFEVANWDIIEQIIQVKGDPKEIGGKKK